MSRSLPFTVLLALIAATPAWAEDRLPLPTLGNPPAAPAGSPGRDDPLTGLWRVRGKDRVLGPFGGFIRFTPDGGPDRYVYERTLELAGARRFTLARQEQGTSTLTGRHIHTQQRRTALRPGLIDALGGGGSGPIQEPLRHGFYRLAEADRAPGFFYLPRSIHGGPEQLTRVGPDSPNNHVELLVDGAEFFPRLREQLAAARRSICVQTFIFTGDSTGRSLVHLLAQKARDGVEVRVLVDRVGNDLGGDLERELRGAGVELVIQHGYGEGLVESVKDLGRGLWNGLKRAFGGGAPAPREERGVFNHDHRKITVVDGRVAFIGGMNLAREYEEVWHDVHAMVEGNAVRELEALFWDRWHAAGGEGQPLEPDPRVAQDTYWPGDMDVDVVEALPGLKTDIKARYLREIRGARRSVDIEVAYFLDDAVVNALKRTASRGVRTVVIVPNDEDHDVKVVRDAFNWVQNDFIRSGARLYKYQGRMVHSKVAAFDGRVATVGSSNLDNMALEKLAEANIFVNDPAFTKTLEQRVFEADLPKCDRQQVKELSWWEKVKGGALHFVRSFL